MTCHASDEGPGVPPQRLAPGRSAAGGAALHPRTHPRYTCGHATSLCTSITHLLSHLISPTSSPVLCSTSTLAHGVNLPAHLGTNGYGAECELLPRNASLYVWCVDSMPHSMYGVSTLIDDSRTHSDHQRDKLLERGKQGLPEDQQVGHNTE